MGFVRYHGSNDVSWTPGKMPKKAMQTEIRISLTMHASVCIYVCMCAYTCILLDLTFRTNSFIYNKFFGFIRNQSCHMFPFYFMHSSSRRQLTLFNAAHHRCCGA